MKDSIMEIMVEAGIALHGGGKPFTYLRKMKNAAKQGTPLRRTLETLMEQDAEYLRKAVEHL